MTKPIVIEAELCKGCGLCISACPKNCIIIAPSANALGYFPAEAHDTGGCTGCGNCAVMCPEAAITVRRAERGNATSASPSDRVSLAKDSP